MDLQYDYLIEFDLIPVGTKAKKLFTPPNNIKVEECIIKQLFCTNKVENPFIVQKRLAKGEKQEKSELIVKYFPKSSNQKYVGYFSIQSEDEKAVILRITGTSEGLTIQMSVKHLDFYRFQTDKKCKAVFELQNNSNTTIIFQFDIDNNQNIYEVEPIDGKILPKEHLCISLRFVTTKTGVFLMELPCLFTYHAPIFIRLFGVNSATAEVSDLDNLKALCSVLYKSGYEKYMTDYYGCPHLESACFLSERNFDFHVKYDRISSTTEISNYTNQCLKIIWDTESTKNFYMEPVKTSVRPQVKGEIECKFEPSIPEFLFGAQIYGKVLIYEPFLQNDVPTDDSKCSLVPISIRVIGSSFAGPTAWNPYVDIYPEFICMPVCGFNDTVYTTFIMKRLGPFPITYKFVPPIKTNFQVRPQVGIITGEFQICVVKFSQKCEISNTYKEIWDIELNQRKESIIQLKFKAIIEEPNVTVGDGNKIWFGNLFPGCKKHIKVPIFNYTQNTLRIKFVKTKWFKIDCGDGIIDCYDSILTSWCYTADCDLPKNYELKYELFALHERSLIVGLPTYGYVTIVAGCTYTKLCASPISHDFKDVICGQRYRTTFSIFNFGKCELHFTLKCYEHFGCFDTEPFRIKPTKGSLAPKESLQIEVSLLTYCSCLSTFCIQYHVREEKDSNVLVPQKARSWKTHGILFRMDYYSFYPTLQFVDIGKNSTGPLFGKVNIWEFFHIDSLNVILRTIKANETRRLDIRVPEAQYGISQGKQIIFIIKNVTSVNTTCRFQRKKICDCVLKQASGTTTFRKYTYEGCPHRKLLELEPPEECIQANSIVYLAVNITYNMLDRQQLCYLMHLSHNRTIELYFNITSLRAGELSTFKFGFEFQMKDVFIGELDPHIQLYWIANNTHQNSRYQLDIKPLIELNKRLGFDIITCLNPKSNVESKSKHMIKFLFKPISVGYIQISLPFSFGPHMYNLSIYGEGTSSYVSPITKINSAPTNFNFYNFPNLLVHISTETIIIDALPTHSKTTRLFTLRNVTKNSNIGFWVESDKLKDIMHVTVNPSKGVIKPRGVLPLVLTVRSFGSPSAIRATCPVHFINQTALNEHMKSRNEYYKQATESQDFFTITEHKTEYMIPHVEITPQPQIFHRNIVITCNIIGLPDIDIKIPVQEQLKQQPCEELCIYRPKILSHFLRHLTEYQIETLSVVNLTKRNTENHKQKIQKLLQFKHSDEELNTFSLHSLQSLQNIIINEVEEEETSSKEEKCDDRMCCTPLTDEQYVVVHTVLECLISNIVYSEKFKYHILHDMKNECNYYYKEFNRENIDPVEEEFMTKLFLNRIPEHLLSETLQILIGDAVIQQFHLGMHPMVLDKTDAEDNDEPSRTHSIGKDLYAEHFGFLLNI